MKGISAGESSGPWIERARVQDRVPTQQAPAGGRSLQSASAVAAPGWDPYEVWLHRIRRPQQRRNGSNR